MEKINKITHKIDYIGKNVQAQGCNDDCMHFTDQYAVGESDPPSTDGPGLVFCTCSSRQLPSDSQTWPLW